jgi:hypothetical protein
VNNSLDVEEHDEHALDFAFHLLPFSVLVNLYVPFKHPVRLMFSSPKACLIIAGVPFALFPKFDAVNFQIHPEITSGQIQDSK